MPKTRKSADQIAAEVAAFGTKPDCAYINIYTLSALFNRSTSSTYRDIQRGLLPKPTRIGASSRWQVGTIRKILAEDRGAK